MTIYFMSQLLGAVDLGGTKIISAVFTADCEIIGPPVETPTHARSNPEAILENIRHNFNQALEASGKSIKDILCLGIGVPTTIQYDKGLIDGSPNLPTMTDFPLAGKLSGKMGIPVVMEHDSGCFILGELVRGAVAGCEDCCGVTIGTGLGLGLVLGGKLLYGAQACAGEIWKCPYSGDILENHVSGSALARKYKEKNGKELSGREVYEKASEGDSLSLELFRELGLALGHGLSYLVNILNPEKIVIGGSVAGAWDFFIGQALEVIDKHRVERNSTEIVKSKLGKLAPLYGAAMRAEKTTV